MDKASKTLRKILDAATEDNYKEAIQALEEYAKFRVIQDKNFESDFEAEVKKLKSPDKKGKKDK